MDEEAKKYIERYQKAKAFREQWVPLFEECYEYALPQRESFYYEEAGQRRDDKIFDETAVVGVQEFASRLQSGLVPNFARWADLTSGSEVPRRSGTQSTANSMKLLTMCLRFYRTRTLVRRSMSRSWIWLLALVFFASKKAMPLIL